MKQIYIDKEAGTMTAITFRNDVDWFLCLTDEVNEPDAAVEQAQQKIQLCEVCDFASIMFLPDLVGKRT